MKAYLKGYKWERIVRKYLESFGYFCQRSGGSKLPDLVAIEHQCAGIYSIPDEWGIGWETTLFIECKAAKEGRLTKEEVKRMKELAKTFGGTSLLAKPLFGVSSQKEGNVILTEIK